MVLLYVVLTNSSPLSTSKIFDTIGTSLETFAAMKTLAVARRCREVTTEVLGVAKRIHSQRSDHPPQATNLGPSLGICDQSALGSAGIGTEIGDLGDSHDLFANLIDTDLVFNLLNFEDWNAWSRAEYT